MSTDRPTKIDDDEAAAKVAAVIAQAVALSEQLKSTAVDLVEILHRAQTTADKLKTIDDQRNRSGK